MNLSYKKLEAKMRAEQSEEKSKIYRRFFKTGPGEYGEGDLFLGLTVPQSRAIAKTFKTLPLNELEHALQSPFHEIRLVTLLILVDQFQRANKLHQKVIFDFYLAHTLHVNNWDLVDCSADKIVGAYLYQHRSRLKLLKTLSHSKHLWERRISVLATFYFIKKGELELAMELALRLSGDSHDLIHKAVGWMLREVGKKDPSVLKNFLKKHSTALPRTTLRYAIERFSPDERTIWLQRSRPRR